MPQQLFVRGSDVVDASGNLVYGYYLSRDGDIINSDGAIVVPAEEISELTAIQSVRILEDIDSFALSGKLSADGREMLTSPKDFSLTVQCSGSDYQNSSLSFEILDSALVSFIDERGRDLGPAIRLDAKDGVAAAKIHAERDGVFTLQICNGFGELLDCVSITVKAEASVENPCMEHEFEDKVILPTLWSNGYTVHTCETCGYAYIDTYTQASDHVHAWTVRAVIEPSYIAGGYTLEECSICHQLRRVDPTQKLFCDHGEELSIVIEPSCTEEGYTLHECAICRNFSWKDEFTPATGHHMTEVEIPATYQHGTMIQRVCSACGYEESAVEVSEPLCCRHSHMAKERVKATCTESGYTLHYCVKCGYSYTDSKVDPLGHRFKDKVVKPTAEQEGYTLHTCTRCGYSYKDNFVPKLGS